MIGGGQLARMTHQAAIPLGQSLRVLATSPTDSAALVAADVHTGAPDDSTAVLSFSEGCDVITFDHEQVPIDVVRSLVEAGHLVFPGPEALIFAQDKGLMREKLAGLDLPVPDFLLLPALASAADLTGLVSGFAADHGWPVMLKTCRGGYDGRGVWSLESPDDARTVLGELAGKDLLIEECVDLRRELAAVAARSPFGQAASWPIVETVQENGICVEVLAPAPGLPAYRALAAEQLALTIASTLGVVGVLAVELFEVAASERYPDGLVINELAMRPHNSAHWTQDGSVTSQFEQHLRAVLDYPLGSTTALRPVTVMANVLGAEGAASSIDERVHHLAARFPEAKVHLYGKSFRVGRKLGHVNVTGSELDPVRTTASLAARYLGSGLWPDGYSVEAGHAASEVSTAASAVGREAG
jgi:5-(carboxyamino)imidazole ribonucleotide synthase